MQNPAQEITQEQPAPSEILHLQSNNLLGIVSICLRIAGIGLVIGIGGYLLGQRKSNIVATHRAVQASPTIISKSNASWQTYTSQKFNYTVMYPSALEINQMDLQNAPYSVIFHVKQTQPGPNGFPALYISVIPDKFTNTNSVVYNFMPVDIINNFFTMNVGEVKQTQTSTYAEFWTYKKLPDEIIAGQRGILIENNKVWGGGNGLADRRVYIKKDGYTYMIGTYYQTLQELNNFKTFLSSFNFTKK